MRSVLGSAVLCAAALASPAAMAGVTGNAGAVTEYLFRGIEQSAGAAVQGGLDYSHGSGLYAGTWVSNTSFAPSSTSGRTVSYETDVYGGWTTKFGDLGVDIGAIYYHYRDESALNTVEAYLGAAFGPLTVKAFYTPEYFGAVDASGDDEPGLYLTASAGFALNTSLTVTPQVGFSSGDGPKAIFGDEYTDFSVTLAKTLDNGFAFSFAAVGTDIEDDDEKLVIGLKKTFDL